MGAQKQSPNPSGWRGQRRLPGEVTSFPGAHVRPLKSTLKYHGQVLFLLSHPLRQISLLFYLQVGRCPCWSFPTSLQCLTSRALSQVSDPEFSYFSTSRPGSCQRRSQSSPQMAFPWILATLKASTWLTSSCWTEAAGRVLQGLMIRGVLDSPERLLRQRTRAAVEGTRRQKGSPDPWLQGNRQKERFGGKVRYTNKKQDKEKQAE